MNPSLGHRGLRLDPALFACVIALLVLGSLMVSSASITLADSTMGGPHYFLLRHFGAILIGCLGAAVALVTPMQVWFRLSGLLLLAAIALLASVFVPGFGHTVNGSTRWLDLGPLTLQPSEPARLCLLLYLSAYVVRHHTELTTTTLGLLKPMPVIALACGLLLAEPDFGAAVVLTVTSLGLLFVGGARLRGFFLAFAAAAAALVGLALSSPYRLQRLTTFLDPWADPFASGFQLTQSLIAIGRGDWLGVGLGESVQKLFYLPEAHTDFIFAVMAEELGFIGVTLTIVLLGIVVFKAIAVGPRAGRLGMPFQGLVSTGIGLTLGLQAFISVGVNTGLLPTKGLTLPLVSYGRTSVVITLVALGLLARICHEVTVAEPRARDAGKRKR
ncbi:MAG: putative lipid II flippase FtsW [Rhodospirillaceae bacterium]|nr:putative lipid II flippase FtsW [Rhodospirillaceae bacterium]